MSGLTILAFFWWVLRKSARAAQGILRANPEWPKVTNLPDLPPWHVTRREQAGLVARLESGASVAIRAAVAGQGGMGKSTLALAAAHDLKRKMQGVWWVQAATGDSLRSSLALLGRELHTPGAENPNTVQAAQATLTHLRNLRDPWLLIYDNADDTVMVGPWLPQGCPHVRVLLTSRAADWPQEQRLDLGAMAPAESLAMLRAGLPGRGAEDLAALADRLGHWPLALTAAIGFLTVHGGTTVADYLRAFDVTRAELLRLDWTGVSYADPSRPETLSVAAAMRLTTDRLSADDRDLLSVLAWLNPDDLWPEMVAEGAASEVQRPFNGETEFPAFLTRAGTDAGVLTQALDRLRAVSLVFGDDGTTRMHRLFAELWRAGLEGPAQWSNAAARVVNAVVPYDTDSEANWPTCARLTGHARALLAAGAGSLAAARLFAQIGTYLLHRGPQPGDRALAQGAADTHARLAPGSASHAASLNNLASFQLRDGDLPAALATHEQVRAISAALPEVGPDHPDYAITLNNLAGVHRALGDYPAAEPLHEEALRIFTAALGAGHPATITQHRNLGALYFDWAQAAPDRASTLRQKEAAAKATALHLSLLSNGPRHQSTATDRNNAAVRLAQAGDLPAACTEMRIAAAIRLDMIPGHSRAAESLRAYAKLALRTGERPERLLPALLAEARAQRQAHVVWGQDTLARLLRDHGIDGAVSGETLTALAQRLAAQQAAMRAEGKPVDAAT